MIKVSLLIVLSCLLTFVQPGILPTLGGIKEQLPSVNLNKYIPSLDTSKLNISYLNIPGLTIDLPMIDIEKPELLPKLPSINDVVNNMTEISSSVVQKINKEITDFLSKQIDMFKNVSLKIYNDLEEVVDFKLELPDFNVLNLFSDLNEKVTFRLYTKGTGNNSEILKINDKTALRNSNFNPKRNTFFITHGFMASCDGPSCTLVRDALLNTSDSNVITVNWSPFSIGDYVIARLFVPRVGAHIGKFLNFLYENGLNHNMVTLIGHSLGAQIMGFAGQTSNQKVKNILGMDPAWPLFVFLPDDDRLSPDDAQNVEVIHTNGGLLGVPFVTGHYDFYPNGGFYQFGCAKEFFSPCSHGRSYRYLSEEITNPGPDFYARKCKSYSDFLDHQCSNDTAVMGKINFLQEKRGEYYLQTKDGEPFSLGLIGLLPAV